VKAHAPTKQAAPAKVAAPARVVAKKEAPAKAAAPTKQAVSAKPAAPAKKAAAATKPAPAKKAAAPVAAPAKVAQPAAPVAKKALAKKIAPPRPTATYAGDQKFLEHQRELLLQERSTYLQQSELLKAEAESLVEEMEPGDIQFDEESGEGGTLTVDRERDLVLSAQAQLAVEDIDDALRKITRGRYGICEGCGELISKPRLEAMPFARLCIACKSGGLSRR